MIRTEISDSRLQTSVSNLSSLCNIVETEETHATFKITEDFFFFFFRRKFWEAKLAKITIFSLLNHIIVNEKQ